MDATKTDCYIQNILTVASFVRKVNAKIVKCYYKDGSVTIDDINGKQLRNVALLGFEFSGTELTLMFDGTKLYGCDIREQVIDKEAFEEFECNLGDLLNSHAMVLRRFEKVFGD